MDDATTNNRDDFPIVVLCGSAGALKALQSFFEAMPVGAGMAFIVIQHQNPRYESLLSDILKRHTKIPVTLAEEDMPLWRDRIHVCPASDQVTLADGRFRLRPRSKRRGWQSTIDRLLETSAGGHGERVVAVMLSGAGTDGVEGARAVSNNDGRVIAQEPSTASHTAIVTSVINEGLADAVMPPEQMPDYLYDVLDRPPARAAEGDDSFEVSEVELELVVRRLRRQTGRNFTDYKSSTMQRQVAQRMARVQADSIDDYLDYMEEHPEEAEKLIRYLLIHVTSFFRDPAAFDALKEQALLPLLRELDVDTVFRAWVAGCASGEEAVSVAILIYECLQELDMLKMEVHLFATDAKRELIQQARLGVYPATIAEDVTADRLQEHFIQEEGGYRVRNHILRMIVWSEHNLVEQPPFSRLHFISCRNVLIYFKRHLQEYVTSLFQFALSIDGVLFLGSAETITFSPGEFTAINSKYKIYRKMGDNSEKWLQLDRPLFKKLTEPLEQPMPAQDPPASDSPRELQIIREMLIEHVNASYLIVDESYHLLFSYGEVDRYLSVMPGKNVQQSVLQMAREGLAADLTVALHRAFEDHDETVERAGVWVRTNGDERIVHLTVRPIRDERLSHNAKLVILELVAQGNDLRNIDPTLQGSEDEPNATIVRLRQELAETKEALRTTTRTLQTKNEDLTSSIEEIKTTNEELRTSKEELESMNEELNTLNTQLTDQNEELTRSNNTLYNFLQSAELGMIILNQNMAVREFTRAATQLFRLRPEDRGRPLADLRHELDYDKMLDDADHVLETLENVERVVSTESGRWLTVHMRPYRTIDHVIDGVVMSIVDVTAQKQAQQEAEAKTDYMRQVFDTLGDSLLELDSNLRVVAANTAFYQTFQVRAAATIGRRLYDLGNSQWDIPDLRRLLQEIIPEKTTVRDYQVSHEFPDIGLRTMRLNARQIERHERILLVITDVSVPD